MNIIKDCIKMKMEIRATKKAGEGGGGGEIPLKKYRLMEEREAGRTKKIFVKKD